MSAFRTLSPKFSASPAPGDGFFAAAAAEGFTVIVNNRPDGEDPTQVSSAQAEAAAKAVGLAYVHIPVTGMPGDGEAAALREVLATATGPVLAYCRSGTRSAATYCLAQALRGAPIEETLSQARAAGYDLSALTPLMQRLQPA
jgi:uncharacterized protein (TIGR01244 family)